MASSNECMNVTIKFRVLAHKFYQTYFRKDYYNLFTKKEKKDLKNSINDALFLSTLIAYTSNSGEYYGSVTVNSIVTVEENDCLYIIVKESFTNPDKYTATFMKELIQETVRHYFAGGPACEFGEVVWYVASINEADLHRDYVEDEITVVTEDDKGVRRGKYDFHIYIEGDIEVENEEVWNSPEYTNKTAFKRDCPLHMYYLYQFSSNDRLLDSRCLGESVSEFDSESEEVIPKKDSNEKYLSKSEIEEIIKLDNFIRRNTAHYFVTDNLHKLILSCIKPERAMASG